ncbi:MAG: hypothetical protein KAW12_24350 [Candidatus Aminicenantes bacterium]|nr:hypothetical protein [Candidatus Aminicenantes bacterium]
MKKQVFLVFMLLFLFQLPSLILAKKVELIKRETCIGIDLEKVKAIGNASLDDIWNSIKNFLPEEFDNWKKDKLTKSAVIFVKHVFNEDKIRLEDAVKVRAEKIKKLTESITGLQNSLNNLENVSMGKDQLINRREIKSEIEQLGKERLKLQRWFFEKENNFEVMVLHKEKKEWSTYLFGTRRFLIILLGGEHDLRKAKVSAERRASVLKKSLQELSSSLTTATAGMRSNLAGTINGVDRITDKMSTIKNKAEEIKDTITEVGKIAEVDTKLSFKKKQKTGTGELTETAIPRDCFPCRIIELNPKKVAPPCIISVDAKPAEKNKAVFNFPVAERNIFQLNVGVATSSLPELSNSLNGGSGTVSSTSTDTTAGTEESDIDIKENLFFVFDFHAPRDMETFRPKLLKPWENFGKRLGFFVGLKLSADPLESLYTGVSFALTPGINMVGGLAFHRSEVEVSHTGDESSGPIAEPNNSALWNYDKPQLFFGLSVSPALILRLFGIQL